jgi:hypothetical protein
MNAMFHKHRSAFLWLFVYYDLRNYFSWTLYLGRRCGMQIRFRQIIVLLAFLSHFWGQCLECFVITLPELNLP